MDNSSKDALKKVLASHLIGLCWYEGRVNEAGDFIRQPDFRCASGFLLQVRGTYCLVTAGHVRTEYFTRTSKGLVGRTYSLFDIWGTRSTCAERIPFDFMDAPALVRDEPETGLDFAIIGLPDLVLRLLLQTTTPVREEDWLHDAGMKLGHYAIVGIPFIDVAQVSGSDEKGNSITTYPKPRLISVKRYVAVPNNVQKTEIPQFVGEIDPNETISDIAGTSGGPVFGFCQSSDGRFKCCPVAIQSRWLRSSRIVIGTWIPVVAQRVDDWITQVARRGAERPT